MSDADADGAGDFEPLIGEIRAVRTFRVGAGGALFPLFSKTAWEPGANEAHCHVSADSSHTSPDPDCSCGFYAYADERSAREYPFARYTLAVISCWGRVVSGTRGLRTQFARIEGIWFSPAVPRDLVDSVAARYPGVAVFDRREDLLADELTARSATAPPEWTTAEFPPRILARTVAALAVLGGCLPAHWIARVPYGWWLWSVLLGYLLLVAFVPRRKTNDIARARHRLVSTALALWLVAPLAGIGGLIFLRVPLLQIAVLMIAQRSALHRAARIFPAPI